MWEGEPTPPAVGGKEKGGRLHKNVEEVLKCIFLGYKLKNII